MNGSWDAYLASPADFFVGADDITKEREPGIEIIERTPLSLIITSNVSLFSASAVELHLSLCFEPRRYRAHWDPVLLRI